MKAIDNINKIIENFLSSYGCVKIICSTEFQYYLEDDIISWSFLTSERQDKNFCNFFEEELGCPKCNSFIYSLFHEYGHKMTLDSFSELDWDLYQLNLDEIGSFYNGDEKDYAYYHLPIERVASEWAVNFIKLHYDEIKLWFDTELSDAFNSIFKDEELAAIITELVEGE